MPGTTKYLKANVNGDSARANASEKKFTGVGRSKGSFVGRLRCHAKYNQLPSRSSCMASSVLLEALLTCLCLFFGIRLDSTRYKLAQVCGFLLGHKIGSYCGNCFWLYGRDEEPFV